LKEKRRRIGWAGRRRGCATRSAEALRKRGCRSSRGQHAAIYEGLPARQSAPHSPCCTRACATQRQAGAERGEAGRRPRCPPPRCTTGLCLAPTPGLHSSSRLPDPSERPFWTAGAGLRGSGERARPACTLWSPLPEPRPARCRPARSCLLGGDELSRQLCQQQTVPEGVWRSPSSQAALP